MTPWRSRSLQSQRSRYLASVAAFTLIEILVVLVIIGIISTVAVLSLGDGGRRDKLLEEATRLQAVLKLAQEESQLYGVEMGMVVAPDDYQFVTFARDRWTPVADDKAYKKHKINEEFQIALKIEGFKLGKQNGMLPGADIKDGKVTVREDEDEKNDEKVDDTNNNDDDAEKDTDTTESDSSIKSEGVTTRAPVAKEKNSPSGKKTKSLLPQVFLLSSGEVNPFTLTIGSTAEPAIFYRLRGKFDGSVLLEGPLEGDLIAEMDKPWRDEKAIELDSNGNEIERNDVRDEDRSDSREAKRE